MNYQDKVKVIFGNDWGHYTLRTLFDNCSAEWDFLTFDDKYEILLTLSKKQPLIEWVNEFMRYYKYCSSKTYVTERIEFALEDLTWNCPYEDMKALLKETLSVFTNMSMEEINEKEKEENLFKKIRGNSIKSKGNLDMDSKDYSINIEGNENIVINDVEGEIVINKNYTPKIRTASLRLVDVLIKHEDRNPLPILDIKVRNNSDEVILLKKIEIECLRIWKIALKKDYNFIPSSWRYNITIQKEGTTTISELSQCIQANCVDRFEIQLRTEHGVHNNEPGVSPHLIRFKLVYNENDQFLISKKILLHIPSYTQVAGSHSLPTKKDEMFEIQTKAKEVLNLIDNNTIVQEGIIEVIKDWANIIK